MYIVIGGLLVMSLLSTSPIKKTEHMVNHLIKLDGKPIHFIIEDNLESLYHKNIDRLMSYVSKNNIKLNDLLIKKNELLHKVQNEMDISSNSKKYLTEEQIEMFVQFTNLYNNERNDLKHNLEIIFEDTYLNGVQQDVLSTSIDYDLIIAKLRNLANNQDEAIERLQDIVNLGEDTLNVLNK